MGGGVRAGCGDPAPLADDQQRAGSALRGFHQLTVKDRAHYIQWSASQPCLRPAPESRLCGYLWRRKWLGQWTKQLFIIRNDVLLVS
ncbi:Actin filament-associated protein 1-like 2 [Collichthys lucidus]|uniref:Actin filament-associated protein 1-like 2 n=1 Tax=Collichthys lucidus TaxID=240159 RepID=A0A4V6AQ54_COLLU|nr:Actin filament-associated protein 1-like 2 [Collichthys lucidus]